MYNAAMIFYVLAGLAALAIAAGYMQEEMHVMAIALGVAVFVHATRNSSIRMGAAYSTVVLCILGVVVAGATAIWTLAEQYWAAAGATVTLAALTWVTARTAPRGIRIMRLVFGGNQTTK